MTLNSFLFSQISTSKELMENEVREVIIFAKQFQNNNLSKVVKSKKTLNEKGKPTLFITYDEIGGIKSEYKTHYINEGKTQIDTIKDKNVVKSLKIFNEDYENRTITHYQISPMKDTLIFQTWYLNTIGKDSILVNKYKDKKSYIAMKWFYDSKNELLKTESYLENGKINRTENFKYETINDCKIYYDNDSNIKEKKCKENQTEVTYFFKNHTGYLYGIVLNSEIGGKKIVFKSEKGLVDRVQYFDKNLNKLSEIEYFYNK